MIKVRCTICKAEAIIDPVAKTMQVVYQAATSPFGGKYPHRAISECVLAQGFLPDELITQPTIEVLES